METSIATSNVLKRLRPPFARSAQLISSYTLSSATPGITVALPAGEPAIAAGSGAVQTVRPSPFNGAAALAITIDHGSGVTTTTAGLTGSAVTPGSQVLRGDLLGSPLTGHVLFSASVGGIPVDPLRLNRHWLPQNANVVTGQGGYIRFAPDRMLRDLSGGIAATVTGGVTYFTNLLAAPAPLLLNVAFNGDGSKTGSAATGSTGDFWNVYAPVDFTATVSSSCSTNPYNFYVYEGEAAFNLNTSDGVPSSAFIERIAPLFSAAGSGSSWDNMLKFWVGGYLGPVPYENSFRLRNLTAGQYTVYLYGSQGTYPASSTFYVSLNNSSPVALSTYPQGDVAFVPGHNYVSVSFSVPAGGYITIKAVGYLSGLQVQRTD